MRIIMAVFALALWSCSERNDQSTEKQSHQPDAHAGHTTKSHSGLMLSESQVRLANITTQKVNVSRAERLVSANARLVTNEELTEIISARVQGRLEKLFVKETGKPIRKGEPLYEIYSEQLLTLQQDFLLALAQYEGLNTPRYEDYLKSARKKLILYGLTDNQVNKLAETRTVQSRTTFIAPASGTVRLINVVEGQYVNEGDALYQLENTQQLWVEAELYPDEARMLGPGAMVTVRVNGFEQEPVESKVEFVNPEYRANSQVLLVRSSLANKNNQWQAGMQAEVFLSEGNRHAIMVPLDAVIRDERGAMVFVKSADHTFIPRMVKTGFESFSAIEIREGLKEGEELVVSGAYLIYSELVLKNGSELLTHNH